MGMILYVLGIIVAIGGGLWLLVEAFREGLGWGLACLLIPLVTLAFVFTHWDRAQRPFLVQVAGWGLVLLSLAFQSQ